MKNMVVNYLKSFNKILLIFLLLVFLALNSSVANAADFGFALSNQGRITSRDGLIWIIAINDSYTNKYWNGSSWINGNSPGSDRYAYDQVKDIFIDNQKRLWFSGVYNSDDDQYATGYIQMNAPGECVSYYGYDKFVEGKDGSIWTYGYPDGEYYVGMTIAYFNGNGFNNVAPAPFNETSAGITVDHNGNPWLSGKNNKVYYWNGSSWINCSVPFSNYLDIRALATAEDGSIIAFGTNNYYSGWAIYKNGVWTIKQEANNSSSGCPIDVWETIENGPDGKIWGVWGSSLVYYKDGVWTRTIPAPFGNILDFTVDDSGIVWAINSNRVAAYIGGQWFTDTDSLSSKLIEETKKSADKAALEAETARVNSSNAYNSATVAATNASNAYNAANTASTNASTAATNAQNAYDAATTAATNASTAATKATNAYNAANTAASNAQNAYNAATTAATNASTAATNASTAATKATNAYNAANTAASNAQNAYNAATTAATSASSAATNALNAYNNTIYDGESAAYWAYLAANNINVDDTPPVIQKLSGANGATCTTKSSFSVVVNASDNKPGQLQARAKVDSGSFGSWVNIPQSAISVTLSTSGAHTITVEVKDAAGNVSSATMIAFRI